MTEKPIFVSGGHKYYVAYFQNGNLIIRGNKNPLNQFVIYRHSSIYAVNVGTQNKNCGSKNRVNQGYLVVLNGRNI